MYSFGFEWTRLCTYPIFTEWLTVVSCTIVCSKSHAVTPCKFIWCFWMYQAYRYSPFIPRFFIKTFLKAVFTAKLRERSRDFPCTPAPQTRTIFPFTTPACGPSCPYQPRPRGWLTGYSWRTCTDMWQPPGANSWRWGRALASQSASLRTRAPGTARRRVPAPRNPLNSACPSSPDSSFMFFFKKTFTI